MIIFRGSRGPPGGSRGSTASQFGKHCNKGSYARKQAQAELRTSTNLNPSYTQSEVIGNLHASILLLHLRHLNSIVARKQNVEHFIDLHPRMNIKNITKKYEHNYILESQIYMDIERLYYVLFTSDSRIILINQMDRTELDFEINIIFENC